MDESGRYDKRISCHQWYGAVILLMLYTSTGYITDLIIAVGMRLLANVAAVDSVNMIFLVRGQVKMIQR